MIPYPHIHHSFPRRRSVFLIDQLTKDLSSKTRRKERKMRRLQWSPFWVFLDEAFFHVHTSCYHCLCTHLRIIVWWSLRWISRCGCHKISIERRSWLCSTSSNQIWRIPPCCNVVLSFCMVVLEYFIGVWLVMYCPLLFSPACFEVQQFVLRWG